MTELEEVIAERDQARGTVRAIHRMLDNCNVIKESVVWNGGVQTVTEYPATERLSMLLQAWVQERKDRREEELNGV